jgi:hypothetical protein
MFWSALKFFAPSWKRKSGTIRDVQALSRKVCSLRSKRLSSPCIFPLVVSLSIRSFLVIGATYPDTDCQGFQNKPAAAGAPAGAAWFTAGYFV